MIIGIGIDLLEHDQLVIGDKGWEGAFFRHTFSEAEQAEAKAAPNPLAHFAGRFCVKEAVIKALAGYEHDFNFCDIETLSDEHGQPHVRLVGKLEGVLPSDVVLHVTISHTPTTSTALVIAENVSLGRSQRHISSSRPR